jgi:hypothetical protein
MGVAHIALLHGGMSHVAHSLGHHDACMHDKASGRVMEAAPFGKHPFIYEESTKGGGSLFFIQVNRRRLKYMVHKKMSASCMKTIKS